jgi:hypothetical protein
MPPTIMNTGNAQFDRLVDDELNEEERRELLGRLDDEPGGWRQCALAFLEAQCWKQSLGGIFDEGSRSAGVSPAWEASGKSPPWGDAGETPALQTTNPQRSPWAGRLRLFSAMAASFLLALWVGSLGYRMWPGHTSGIGTLGEIAQNNVEVHRMPLPDQPASRLAVASPDRRSTSNPWQLVTVSAPSGQGASQPLMRVPAIERNNIDEQWLRNVPSAIPDDVARALARTGHQVQQRRELLPVPMNDGRRLVVPVDKVDIHYTGNGAL